MVYRVMAFGGHITRIELYASRHGRKVANVWGGHQGIVASKGGTKRGNGASILGRRIAWGQRITDLLREG